MVDHLKLQDKESNKNLAEKRRNAEIMKLNGQFGRCQGETDQNSDQMGESVTG